MRSTPGKAGRYTGKLRNDILFSDGSPMTAADLKSSLEAHWAREHGATITSRGDDITFQLNEHRNEMGRLFARFASVAAANPLADL